jgi:two-component system, chemotaxis family, protein-glutamate methylesterase/glutaminase
VVIGASAGGVEVLSRVVRDLPADLAAAICIVLHVAPGSPNMLAHILGRAGKLPCRPARDGEHLREGVILVAPANHHVAIEGSRVRLTVGPRENGHRPAINVLFGSAAQAFDGRVVGVVLSGKRDNGSAGLAVIKGNGGATIVQDPREAMYSGMPTGAIAVVSVDAIVPLPQVASTIAAMVKADDPRPPASSTEGDPDPPGGEQVNAVCPECGGVLTERTEAGGQMRSVRRFRRQSRSATAQAELARRALAGAGTTLRRVSDEDEEQRAGEEGAA